MPVSNWSTTAASNGATLGIDVAENCDAANVNNAIREMMAQLKTKLDAIDAAIGSGSYQPLDALLSALAALSTSANQIAYFTGSDTVALTTLSTYMRTVLDDGDAATAQNTLGAVGIVASSIVAGGGYVKFNIGGTTFILQWKDASFSGDGGTVVTFPTAFASWSRAWVNTLSSSTTAEENFPVVSANGTASCTVTSASDVASSGTVFAIGV